MGGNQCCSESSKCGDQEGDCDRDSDCINGLVCGKDNCIQNNDFWWDATDDCCEKPRSNYESLLYFNLFNPIILMIASLIVFMFIIILIYRNVHRKLF